MYVCVYLYTLYDRLILTETYLKKPIIVCMYTSFSSNLGYIGLNN